MRRVVGNGGESGWNAVIEMPGPADVVALAIRIIHMSWERSLRYLLPGQRRVACWPGQSSANHLPLTFPSSLYSPSTQAWTPSQ